MIAAVTTRITEALNYLEVRDSISHDLIFSLKKQNLIALPITNISKKPEEMYKFISFDLLIVSGGDEFDNNHNLKSNKFKDANLLRNNTEKNFINFCMMERIPIIGICRGMQFINHILNGSIIKNHKKNHINTCHLIESNKKYPFFPDKKFYVNSFHNNIIKPEMLGDFLLPIGNCIDGNIEAYIHSELPILGIMWHPERKIENDHDNFFQKKFFCSAFNFLREK